MKFIGSFLKFILSGLLFVLIVGLLATSCSSDDVEKTEIKENSKKEEIKKDESLKMNTVENDIIKIELVEAKDSVFGADIKFKITNKADYTVRVSSENIYLDDLMLEGFLHSDEILPGKSVNDSVMISDDSHFKDLKELKGLSIDLKITDKNFSEISKMNLLLD